MFRVDRCMLTNCTILTAQFNLKFWVFLGCAFSVKFELPEATGILEGEF